MAVSGGGQGIDLACDGSEPEYRTAHWRRYETTRFRTYGLLSQRNNTEVALRQDQAEIEWRNLFCGQHAYGGCGHSHNQRHRVYGRRISRTRFHAQARSGDRAHWRRKPQFRPRPRTITNRDWGQLSAAQEFDFGFWIDRRFLSGKPSSRAVGWLLTGLLMLVRGLSINEPERFATGYGQSKRDARENLWPSGASQGVPFTRHFVCPL